MMNFLVSFQSRNININLDCLEVSKRLTDELFAQKNIEVIII